MGELPRDLGGGLVLRRATATDVEAITAFNRRIHSWSPRDPLRDEIAAWTRDLLNGRHPTTGPADCTVVQEEGGGAIVSTLLLIGQTWSYGGVPIRVGRPELVGTDPAYRARGLVRAQLETIHEWSAARDDLVLAITGIPWYYRQFGYELTLALDAGRTGYAPQIPPLSPGAEAPYRLRPATDADIPLLMELSAAGARRDAIATVRDEAQWRYELSGRDPRSLYAHQTRIIEAASGEAVGFLSHWHILLEGGTLAVQAYELRQGIPYLTVTPSVLRALRATADRYATPDRQFLSYAFLLGSRHPAFAMTPHLFPQERRGYAWYLRVPDLPRFIRHVAPALGRRLADSALAGYSGERRISFYRDGLRLVFAGGRLVAAERWQPTVVEDGNCAFPGLTFLHLLFGHRSLAEVRHLFADCWADSESAALLGALFPSLPSAVRGLA